MSSPQRVDYSADDGLYIGDDLTLVDNIVDSSGNAQTMTGWTLAWTLRDKPGSKTAHISKTTSDGITIGNGSGTDDRATTAIADTDTEPLPPGVYWYSLVRTDAGSERTLKEGRFPLLERA